MIKINTELKQYNYDEVEILENKSIWHDGWIYGECIINNHKYLFLSLINEKENIIGIYKTALDLDTFMNHIPFEKKEKYLIGYF